RLMSKTYSNASPSLTGERHADLQVRASGDRNGRADDESGLVRDQEGRQVRHVLRSAVTEWSGAGRRMQRPPGVLGLRREVGDLRGAALHRDQTGRDGV